MDCRKKPEILSHDIAIVHKKHHMSTRSKHLLYITDQHHRSISTMLTYQWKAMILLPFPSAHLRAALSESHQHGADKAISLSSSYTYWHSRGTWYATPLSGVWLKPQNTSVLANGTMTWRSGDILYNVFVCPSSLKGWFSGNTPVDGWHMPIL